MAKIPDPIDVEVGGKIKAQRRLAGMSQNILADRLGVTFQQIQKYEKGANRISASKLWDIARFFSVDVSYFFDGLSTRQGMAEDGAEAFVHDFPMTRQSIEISQLAPRLNPRQQKLVLEMMREMVTASEVAEPAL